MKKDIFIGLSIEDGYRITKALGKGAIGSVYLAVREGEIADQRAVKFIHPRDERDGWQNEINKVTRLGPRPEIVRYIASGNTPIGDVKYRWIAWDYVNGQSLRSIIDSNRLTLPILADVINCVLAVLHACRNVNVQHADLHAGNILVADPDPNDLNPDERRIYVTDFGYLTPSHGKESLDDYVGFVQIIREGLKGLDFHSLDGEGRVVFSAIKRRLIPDLLENNPTEGEHVRNPKAIHQRFKAELQTKRAIDTLENKNIGDYLAAELLGDRYDEWHALFVPQFIAAEKLLARNITILTGLRGCGKTTIFRRITALYDKHLGPSGIPGTDTYTGFYLNARSIAEAFPWLPQDRVPEARQQVIHYFHVCWILEVVRWIKEEYRGKTYQPTWLVSFFREYFPDKLIVTDSNHLTSHIQAYFVSELERARLQSRYRSQPWELSALDFLEKFVELLEINMPTALGRPFYFFLDDYSTPLLNASTQQILNAAVFRRSSKVIFKVATESIESIELTGLNGKALEQEDDFSFIDLATEVILQDPSANADLLTQLLGPRLARHKVLANLKLKLGDILGESPYSNAELGRQLRKAKGKTSVKYYGLNFFCSLWSSNVREIISLFSEMISTVEDSLGTELGKLKRPLISKEHQDKAVRNAGARLRNLLIAATDPTTHVHDPVAATRAYGEHLQRICDSFAEIAKHELLTKDSKNETGLFPKQARRIEVTDVTNDLPPTIEKYYRGLLRYGVFIRDWRGKSSRGKAVPRLWFRSLFIPHYKLTFSRRDSVKMSWSEFCNFLEDPKHFAEHWKRKKADDNSDDLFET
ncbi:MAG: protein kinase domain-containing protein [Prosthecobacter sp.]